MNWNIDLIAYYNKIIVVKSTNKNLTYITLDLSLHNVHILQNSKVNNALHLEHRLNNYRLISSPD